ncbi:hypothetical protein EYS14_11005 [Alteromonadaceae bacterium M269]|nr:hypothetical protein EYS14_11005 [Alteromonadaceae bacterium M269]
MEKLLDAIQAETTSKIWQAPIQSADDEQLIELLDNLGFVDIDMNEDFALPKEAQTNALLQLENELDDSSIKAAITTQGSIDLDKLSQTVEIDGSFSFSIYSLEEISSDPLLMRILNFRFHILGLTHSHQGKSFSEQSKKALNWLEQLFSLSSSETVALTNDFEQLFEAFRAKKHFQNSKYIGLLYFNNAVDSNVEARYRNSRKKFLESFPDFGGDLNSEQKGIIRRTNYRRPSAGPQTSAPLSPQTAKKVRTLAATKLNAFGLRLVQIKLFLQGTYAGKLDSDMGSLGLQSILDYKDMENHEDEKLVDEKRFVFRLSNEWWAFNLDYFLELQSVDVDAQEQVGIATKLENLSEGLTSEDKPKFYQEVNKLVEKEHSPDVKKRAKRIKKSRGFFRSISKFFKKVGVIIKKGIKAVIKAIKRLFGWLKNGIRILLLEIRTAVRSLQKSISFVFGKRIIKTGSIVTDFDEDFDVISKLTLDAGDENEENNKAIQQHIKKLNDLKQEIGRTTHLLNNTLPLIVNLLTPSLGWLKAGIALVKALFEFQSKNSFSFDNLLEF